MQTLFVPDPPFVCTTRTQMCAHVNDPMPTSRNFFKNSRISSKDEIRSDIFSCPSATHEKFRLLSQGKESSHSTAYPSFSLLLCAVFSCFQPYHRLCEAYSFTTYIYTGSLTCAEIWVRAVHTKEGGVGQAQTRLNKNDSSREGLTKNCSSLTLPRQGIEPKEVRVYRI